MKVLALFAALIVPLTSGAITLDAAFARILERNPQIQQAKFQLEQAAGRRLLLRAVGYPDARVIAPAGAQGGKRAGESSVQPFAFGQGAFTQAVFDPAVPASFRRGDLEVLIAQQRLNVAVLEQLHAARLAYYTAVYQDALRALAEGQRQRLRENARTQSDRFQAGQSDRPAIAVARLLEQEVGPRIEESRRASSGALLQLAQAMGADVRGDLPTAEGSLAFVSQQLDVAGETRAALAQRADLQLARLLVRAGREDERIAAAGYFPQIDATISGTYIPVSDIRRGSEGSARRSDDIVSSEMRFGGAFTWRVIDNGRVAGAVAQRRALREANEAVLARLEAEVPRALTRLRNNLDSLAARHEALAKSGIVAGQTVAAVQAQLAQGLSSQLEYRTAESDFLKAQAGLLTAAYEQNLALAERDRITGRYFQFSPAPRSVH